MPVLLLFFAEGGQRVKPLRVQQLQACKVALQTDLLRCGGEQQEPGVLAGQCGHEAIVFSRVVRRPVQVVGLIDHHQVPVCGQRLQLALLGIAE